ncbi:unnamed protein product [Moneuplotes crassus]|uniref:B30.2/SPRY domain-containing protein n=1 Tax=Euplotes crassus TaxID=5936 RepID=A0AAD1X6J4_EUPCR|nr:unnamed protein product [Moneuplotes crassus]
MNPLIKPKRFRSLFKNFDHELPRILEPIDNVEISEEQIIGHRICKNPFVSCAKISDLTVEFSPKAPKLDQNWPELRMYPVEIQAKPPFIGEHGISYFEVKISELVETENEFPKFVVGVKHLCSWNCEISMDTSINFQISGEQYYKTIRICICEADGTSDCNYQGPRIEFNDTIGLCINFLVGEVFFTHNGIISESRFLNLDNLKAWTVDDFGSVKLFPFVKFRKLNQKVQFVFDKKNFVFNIDEYIKKTLGDVYKEIVNQASLPNCLTTIAKHDNGNCFDMLSQTLILEYLRDEGYTKTLNELSESLGTPLTDHPATKTPLQSIENLPSFTSSPTEPPLNYLSSLTKIKDYLSKYQFDKIKTYFSQIDPQESQKGYLNKKVFLLDLWYFSRVVISEKGQNLFGSEDRLAWTQGDGSEMNFEGLEYNKAAEGDVCVERDIEEAVRFLKDVVTPSLKICYPQLDEITLYSKKKFKKFFKILIMDPKKIKKKYFSVKSLESIERMCINWLKQLCFGKDYETDKISNILKRLYKSCTKNKNPKLEFLLRNPKLCKGILQIIL